MPGLREKIVGMWESEAEHQRGLQTKVLEAEISDIKSARAEARIGQFLGFLVVAIALISGSLVAVYGSAWVGGLISVSSIVGLATAFIRGRSPR